MSDPDELLDIEQAARFLNVSETSLRRWTNSGRLACLRIGRRRERRFRRGDLLAFMEHQPATQPGAPRSNSPHGHIKSPDGQVLINGVFYTLGAHLCGLFASELARINQVIGFLEDGMRPGCACFYTAPDRARADVLSHLEKSRPSLRSDIAAGRLILSDYIPSAKQQLEHWEARIRGAVQAGAQTLRMVNDLRGLAPKVSEEELFEYEAKYEEFIAKRFPSVSLCQYDVRHFSSVTVLNALKLHRDTFRYPPERVLG